MGLMHREFVYDALAKQNYNSCRGSGDRVRVFEISNLRFQISDTLPLVPDLPEKAGQVGRER